MDLADYLGLATSRASTDLRRYINSDLGFSNQQISNFCNIDDFDFRKKLVCVMYGCVSGEILSLEQAFLAPAFKLKAKKTENSIFFPLKTQKFGKFSKDV